MSITLGTVPEKLTVVLTKDADFFTTLENADGDWPVGSEIKLIFSTGDEWDASMSSENAIFSVDYTEVNTLLAAKPTWAKLFYIEGSAEICWALGQVAPNG